MGLRCSVLGHRYGERERVEERDDHGDELIIAVREVKTCERCGDELVVTESKEVRAVEPPETDKPDETEEQEGSTEQTPVEEPEPPDPGTDDGIILPDEPADRDRGEWPADPVMPDPDEHKEDGEIEWPTVEAEDEGFDAMVDESDEEVADQIIEAVNAQPSHPEGEDTAVGFFRAAPMDDPADASDTDVHADYFCPRCDWEARSLTTSVRRGDICPECRRGYVAERDSA